MEVPNVVLYHLYIEFAPSLSMVFFIFIMSIPVLVRRHLYIAMPPPPPPPPQASSVGGGVCYTKEPSGAHDEMIVMA